MYQRECRKCLSVTHPTLRVNMTFNTHIVYVHLHGYQRECRKYLYLTHPVALVHPRSHQDCAHPQCLHTRDCKHTRELPARVFQGSVSNASKIVCNDSQALFHILEILLVLRGSLQHLPQPLPLHVYKCIKMLISLSVSIMVFGLR
jgi:hypothetical protein